jgi:serine/threonine protein kinase
MTEILGSLSERWRDLGFDENDKPKQVPGEWSKSSEKDLLGTVHFIKDEYHGPWRPEDEQEKLKNLEASQEYLKKGMIFSPKMTRQVKLSPEEYTSLYDLFDKILRYEPEERVSAEELSKHPWFTSNFPQANPAEGAPPLVQSPWSPTE